VQAEPATDPSYAEGVYDLEPFFTTVSDQMLPELAKLDAESVGIRHWFVVDDGQGVTIETADEEADSSKALQSLAADDSNAAYVTYTPGPPSEHVLAYAVLAGSTNSDVRQSFISRRDGSLELGPWQYTV
jgi:hypothetical protein